MPTATLTRPVGILGLGHSLPQRIVSNRELESMVDTSDSWIVTRTGIRQRYLVNDDTSSSQLALPAAQEALKKANLSPEQIDLLICCTVTPDTPMPATACRLQQMLGTHRAGAFDLSVACSGFAYSLTVAQQFVASGRCRYVLVVGVDTLSRITDWTDRSTCVLFGDGAAAAVVGPCEEGHGILGFHFGADGGGAELLKIPAGAGHPGKKRSDFCVHMAGRGVYRFAVQAMGEASLEALKKAGIHPDEVRWFIPHQANLRIIEAASRRLNIDMARVITNVDRFGNTSNASIPLALYEAHQQNCFQSGDVIVTVGFGGGLAWCALVLRWI